MRAILYTNDQVEQNRVEGNFERWDSVQVALTRAVLAQGYADDQEFRTLIGEDSIQEALQDHYPDEDSDIHDWEFGTYDPDDDQPW
jgi:hypothetical protein